MTPTTPGGKLTDLMTRAGRCIRAIKRDAYEIGKEAEVQMTLLIVLVDQAAEIFAAREAIFVEEPSLTLDLEEDNGRTGSLFDSVADVRDSRSGGGAAGDSPLSPPPPE
jgi:hypothetical protein